MSPIGSTLCPYTTDIVSLRTRSRMPSFDLNRHPHGGKREPPFRQISKECPLEEDWYQLVFYLSFIMERPYLESPWQSGQKKDLPKF